MTKKYDWSDLNGLVSEARKGDQKAMSALIEKTQDHLYRFCFFICKNTQQAEDLCQETFLKAMTSLSSLKDDRSFAGWLITVARNLHLDLIKSASHRITETSDEKIARAVGEDQSWADLYSVRQALSQFETDDRLLLLLVDLEERSYAEAGAILGLTEDTVRTRLFRLRKEFVERWKKSETK